MENSLHIKAQGVDIVIPKSDFVRKTRATSQDCVIVSGTLISGIGNIQSDFDVHVFCRERPLITEEMFDEHDWICDDNGQWVDRQSFMKGARLQATWDFWDKLESSIDVRYWTLEEINALRDESQSEYNEVKKTLGMVRRMDYMIYGLGENTALTKILSGRVIQNKAMFDEIFSEFGLKEYCYMASRHHTTVYDDFRDISGAWRSGDFDAAVSFARIYTELTAWCVSHTFGDPNTNRKWILPMTKFWPKRAEQLGADFRGIFLADFSTTEKKKKFVVDCIEWCDKAFLVMLQETSERSEYHDAEEMAKFTQDKLLASPTKASFEQSKVEYEWYRRLFSTDFQPAINLL